MYNLDFNKIHQFLFPSEIDGESGLPKPQAGAVPILNTENPRSGIHICRETIFTRGSLAFICYARNRFKDARAEAPSGVKLCLKVTGCLRKGVGSYGSPMNPEESISFECTGGDAIGLWNVLTGRQTSYQIRTKLPGEEEKELNAKYQPEGSSSFFISLIQGRLSIAVPFSEGEALQFKAVIAALHRILFPHLSPEALVLMLNKTQPPTIRAPVSEPATPSNQIADEGELILRHAGEPEMGMGLRKAIYAIGLQKWNKNRKDVAQYIQKEAGGDTAQKIVDAANQGDFSWFDRVMKKLDNS